MIENAVYQLSAIELLGQLQTESVDLIPADPPYGIDYESCYPAMNGGERKTPGSFGEDKFDAAWLGEAYRVLKPAGALYLCTQWSVIERWKAALLCAGFYVPTAIVWDKGHWGSGDTRFYGPQFEMILFAHKGLHRLSWQKREGNIWRIGGQGNIYNEENRKYHPTQKPVALLKKMMLYSSRIGDLIVDAHCGSGTAAVAARTLQRRFIVGDIQEQWTNVTEQRLTRPQSVEMFGGL